MQIATGKDPHHTLRITNPLCLSAAAIWNSWLLFGLDIAYVSQDAWVIQVWEDLHVS